MAKRRHRKRQWTDLNVFSKLGKQGFEWRLEPEAFTGGEVRRRWLPRHLDIDRTSDQDIQEIVLTTNLTPRKCLGFKTPFQTLIAELGKDVQIRFS